MASESDPADESDETGGKRRVLLAGATGLVGGHCLHKLLRGGTFDEVHALARRPIDIGESRLHLLITAFDDLDQRRPVVAHAGLCALGTTIAKAGSQTAFRRVDHDAVVAYARWARRGGVATFVLVSSVGAAKDARSFYLRVKGQTEEEVAQVGFPRLVILRPGLLLGARQERRLGEEIAQVVLPRFSPVLIGPLRRYRAISAERVAGAMVTAALSTQPGHFIWHTDQILANAGPL